MIDPLPQLFSKAGYRTAAVVNSHNLAPEFGLDRGFEQYRYVEERVSRKEPSFEITDQAMEQLEVAGYQGSHVTRVWDRMVRAYIHP